ncbi:hypothetical protein [Amycolatopsis taiwanensis]|uniref:Uncharacterized protein n=1 Tax=Amycolatopsis taiwanensis TaxID=342230 RepID=A0A9W6VHZ6_9PSEU|nr:hypothetical protein [Amycolatopsis taiwanensis]GLY67912.1 hypothetical protein Atai01_45310 [Amycolatopsis taiwanensis]
MSLTSNEVASGGTPTAAATSLRYPANPRLSVGVLPERSPMFTRVMRPKAHPLLLTRTGHR